MQKSVTTIAITQSALTLYEKELVEQLVWTKDKGRGWKATPPPPRSRPLLAARIKELEDRQKPAGRVIVIRAVARLANHFRADRPPEAWQMLFEDYAEDLEGISEAHLVEVIQRYRRKKRYWPHC